MFWNGLRFATSGVTSFWPLAGANEEHIPSFRSYSELRHTRRSKAAPPRRAHVCPGNVFWDGPLGRDHADETRRFWPTLEGSDGGGEKEVELEVYMQNSTLGFYWHESWQFDLWASRASRTYTQDLAISCLCNLLRRHSFSNPCAKGQTWPELVSYLGAVSRTEHERFVVSFRQLGVS
jgi:hypothetical protein